MAGLKAQTPPHLGPLRRLPRVRDLRRQHARARACERQATLGPRTPPATSPTRRSALTPWPRPSLAALFLLVPLAAAAAEIDAPALYADRCASCHGADRLGGTGPALLPENLGRLKPDQARTVIARGPAGDADAGLRGTLLSPDRDRCARGAHPDALPETPRWGIEEIQRLAHRAGRPGEPARPPASRRRSRSTCSSWSKLGITTSRSWTATGSSRSTRFPSRFALHGGPKFSPDGRFVHLMSRDGWITRYDLWGLQPVAEVRAGINSRNIAISRRWPGDGGRQLPAAHAGPARCPDARASGGEARPGRSWRKSHLAGLARSTRPPRGRASSWRSRTCPRSGRSPTARPAAPDLRRPRPQLRAGHGGGAGRGARFPRPAHAAGRSRSTTSSSTRPTRNLIGSSRDGGKAVVVNLDVRRRDRRAAAAGHAAPGLRHRAWSGRAAGCWRRRTSRRRRSAWSTLADWKVIERIAHPRARASSCAATRPAPTPGSTSMLGPESKDKVQILDKRTLEIVRTLQPAPGKTAAMSSSPATAATPWSQRLARRRRAGRLRRRHLRGGQAPADATSRSASTTSGNKITF